MSAAPKPSESQPAQAPKRKAGGDVPSVSKTAPVKQPVTVPISMPAVALEFAREGRTIIWEAPERSFLRFFKLKPKIEFVWNGKISAKTKDEANTLINEKGEVKHELKGAIWSWPSGDNPLGLGSEAQDARSKLDRQVRGESSGKIESVAAKVEWKAEINTDGTLGVGIEGEATYTISDATKTFSVEGKLGVAVYLVKREKEPVEEIEKAPEQKFQLSALNAWSGKKEPETVFKWKGPHASATLSATAKVKLPDEKGLLKARSKIWDHVSFEGSMGVVGTLEVTPDWDAILGAVAEKVVEWLGFVETGVVATETGAAVATAGTLTVVVSAAAVAVGMLGTLCLLMGWGIETDQDRLRKAIVPRKGDSGSYSYDKLLDTWWNEIFEKVDAGFQEGFLQHDASRYEAAKKALGSKADSDKRTPQGYLLGYDTRKKAREAFKKKNSHLGDRYDAEFDKYVKKKWEKISDEAAYYYQSHPYQVGPVYRLSQVIMFKEFHDQFGDIATHNHYEYIWLYIFDGKLPGDFFGGRVGADDRTILGETGPSLYERIRASARPPRAS